MPVEDRSRLTSAFGKRDIDNGPRDHWGVDFGGPVSGQSVLVKAAASGVVQWIKSIPLRSGPAIGIRHPDGSLTAYLHTRRHKVRPGQRVSRGQPIAETWHTGIPLSNGIHLHFERWTDWRDHRSVHDPIDWLAANGWVIEDGRLYDRPTIIPASSTASTGGLTVSEAARIIELVEGLQRQVSTVYGRDGEILDAVTRRPLATAAQVNAVYVRQREHHAELVEMIRQLSAGTGVAIDYERVEAAAKAGAEAALAEGIELEATVTINKKEA